MVIGQVGQADVPEYMKIWLCHLLFQEVLSLALDSLAEVLEVRLPLHPRLLCLPVPGRKTHNLKEYKDRNETGLHSDLSLVERAQGGVQGVQCDHRVHFISVDCVLTHATEHAAVYK